MGDGNRERVVWVVALASCLLSARAFGQRANEAPSEASAAPAPPPAPVRRTGTLQLLSEDDRYRAVTVGPTTLRLPAAVTLPVGLCLARADGPTDLFAHVFVNAEGGTLTLRRGDRRRLVAGAVLVPIGALMASLLWMANYECSLHSPAQGEGCMYAMLTTWPLLGTGLLFAGVGLLSQGIPVAQPRFEFGR